NHTKDVAAYFELPVKGIILTGGNDIDPKRYGANSNDSTSVSFERDSVEHLLLEIAVSRRLPVLGICRGMQFINVYFGGSLVSDLEKFGKKGHAASAHNVNLIDSKGEFLPGKKTLLVNSYHRQGVLFDDIASSLRLFAESDDKVAEGIYHPSYPIAGIQWHPERGSSDKDFDNLLIGAFIKRKAYWN
ncbi:MAG: gamma-glutamyl-gamma-aminobutyrate hydrolase family protein, partial [Candidatus Paceibacterota bacterium]